MVTHDMFQAMRLADEIIIINNGELIEISGKKVFLNLKQIYQEFFTKHILSL